MKKENKKESSDFFITKCKENRLRITPQRVAIYSVLRNSKDHPNTDAIYKKIKKIFPNISFDTVNRTVLTFADIGLVKVVEGRGDPKRFDPNTDHHHHFRCIKCNEIFDFRDSSFDNLNIPAPIKKHFTVLSKKVILEGICNNCKKKA